MCTIAQLLCLFYIIFDTSRFYPRHGINTLLQTPCPMCRERFIYRCRALSRLYFALTHACRFCPMHRIDTSLQTPCPMCRERFISHCHALSWLYFALACAHLQTFLQALG